MCAQPPEPAPAANGLNAIIVAYDAEACAAHGVQRNEIRRNYLASNPNLRTELEAYFDDEHDAEMLLRRGVNLPRRLPNFDDYERIEYVGHGGMGVIYGASYRLFGRGVALKMILPEHQNDPAIVRLFEIEALHMAELDHPHIVRVHQVGREKQSGRPYFMMDLIKGASLDRRLEEFRRNPRAAAQLLVKVARAVAYAFQRGILHRDLKPGNILLDEWGEPRVTDFGLALRVEDLRAQAGGAILGTSEYMAPEQAAGKELTAATDVYGLGAVLYALLTGRPPFRGSDWCETRELVLEPTAPESPRALNPLVDRDLEAVCLKCLKKNPDERYQSAADLGTDLENWLARRETVARPWSRPYSLLRRIGRNPVTTALIVAAVAVVAAFDVSTAVGLRSERERQVLKSNALAARSVANTFQARLQLLTAAAAREANSPDLQKDMAAGAETKLQAHAERIWTASNGFWRPGESYPVESWFILDRNGVVLAHSNKRDQVVGKAFPYRDYFRGAIGKPANSAHVSRIYRSHLADENYKFAVSAPIWAEGRQVGVLVATVTTNSARGTLLPEDVLSDPALVGQWDGGEPDPLDPKVPTRLHTPGQRLILLHSAFARGDTAVEVHGGALFDESAHRELGHATDPEYADPVADRNPDYAGRWLAAAAPVKNTEFVVIVKQRYDEAVQPNAIFGRLRVMWFTVLGVALVCIGAMARAWWKEG
jgi:eukaryotic-like serine/threonine-protein kinase